MSRARVEDVYRLAPLQAGMLFHSLFDPSETSPYLGQIGDEFVGVLEIDQLRRAWEQVVARHTILRSAFVWENVAEPVQVVRESVELPFTVLDWRHSDPVEQRQWIEELLVRDRAQGFDLGSAPLLRVTVARLGEQRCFVLWTFHHLLLDGWSAQLVQQDVFRAYRAQLDRQPVTWTPPVPYVRYIEWLARQNTDEAHRFWTEYLAGVDAPTPLGVERRHDADGYGDLEHVLDAELTRRVERLARECQVTVGTVLQGAWALLLSRYSGHNDVVFGATVAGRPPELPGVESMVGLFINTLPVRVRLNPNARISTWLGDLQAEQAELRQYEYSSLVDIHKTTEVAAADTLFRSILVHQNVPRNSGNDNTPEIDEAGHRASARTGYPLTVAVVHDEQGILLTLSHDRSMLDRATVERLAGHLQVVLERLCVVSTLGEIDMLSAVERRRVRAWSHGPVGELVASTVPEMVAGWARARPDAVAISAGDSSLTYAELMARASQLAYVLGEHGVGAESVVGVCVSRGVDAVVALLGVLRAGGAYLPLEPEHPEQRRHFMLEDAGAVLLLTEAGLVEEIGTQTTVPVLVLDDPSVMAAPSDAPRRWPKPTDMAYVIYTSGSTGKPKGVVVEHRQVVSRLAGCRQVVGHGPEDVWSVFHALSFDFSVWELWGALTSGARAVIVDRDTARDPEQFLELLKREQVTLLSQTPTAFAGLTAAITARKAATLVLRWVILGGEALIPSRVTPWLQTCGPTGPHLINMYGITETTIHVTAHEIATTDASGSSIGRPLPATTTILLDEHGREVPVGVPGELWVGGCGVARGYLNRPELTTQRFITRTLDGQLHRLYRTGDLACWLPTGELDFLGRTDDQVKIRGYRIELGEIEATLTDHPSLSACAVKTHPDPQGDLRLVAYCVQVDNTQINTSDLRSWAARTLSGHMVPAVFVLIDALPTTDNGKIDRDALPAPGGDRPEVSAFRAPRDPLEEALAAAWADVLQLDRVGIDDEFFALGGDSIRSIQVVSRARALGIYLTPRLLFAHPTIAGLIEHERDVLNTPPACTDTSTEEVNPDRYRLAPLQAGMLFHSLFDPSETSPYLVQFGDEFVGVLEIDQLRRAWEQVVARHTILRSAFVWENVAEPVQVVRESVELPFTVLDWRHSDPVEQRQWIEELLVRDRAQGFDLGSAPLLRVTVARLGEQRCFVLWTFHHLLLDGWSAQLVQQDVFRAYRAQLDRQPVTWTPPVPYVRYIEWLARQNTDEAHRFWTEYLAGVDAPTPLGVERRHDADGYGDLEVGLGADLTDRVATFARTHQLTVGTVIHGAWALLLARYSGHEDVMFGSTTAGRPPTLPGVESMVGLFINTLPVRVRLDRDHTVARWLADLQTQLIELRQHEHTPLVDIQKTTGIASGEALFRSILVYANYPRVTETELPDGTSITSRSDIERTGYPLTAVFVSSPHGMHLRLAFDLSIFELPVVERLAQHVRGLLEGLVTESQLADVTLTSRSERAELIALGQPARLASEDITLVDLVNHWVRTRPHKVAVASAQDSLTYGELGAQSDRVAHVLRSHGVGPGVVVGVCLGRSLDAVVALAGVLKAGGAYLPLDPGHPAERLRFMATDAEALLVLTIDDVAGRLPALAEAVPILALDSDGAFARAPREPLPWSPSPGDLAYVIYTSGSTGTPKGVAVTHDNVVARLAGCRDVLGYTESDVWSVVHALTFDVSVWELWGALTSGGRAVLVDHDTARDGERFLALLDRERVTLLSQTPSAFALLVAEITPAVARTSSLRWVVFGGEALVPARLAPWAEAFGDTGPRLVNMYGITETTVHSTAADVTTADIAASAGSPIGRPLPDTPVFVLDALGNLTPVGVVGELWVGGRGVARGYLNRPELTTARFVDREIGGRLHRLYRSGDLVRWTAAGELDYVGRQDDQVKVRGHRIELGEVEARLAAHDSVTACAVIVREDVPGDKRLVAYCVTTNETEPMTLRAWCAESLPSYMVPSVVVLLDAIPLTVNGKTDRRALPPPGPRRTGTEAAYSAPHNLLETSAPRNVLETTMAEVWAQVLGLDRIGIHDNFFALGGDSILSIHVVSRARVQGLYLTPRLLFDHPTIDGLVAAMVEARLVAGEQGAAEGDIPLGPVQQWWLDRSAGVFNQSRLLRVDSLDPGALTIAVRALVDHHDMLRARLERGPSGWRQFYARLTDTDEQDDEPLVWLEDLSELENDRRWEAMADVADRAQRSVDVTAGLGGWRVVLFDLGPGEGQRLLLVAHHLIIDAVSWHILLPDLAHAYAEAAAGRVPRLPVKTTPFHTWTRCLAKHARDDVTVAELDHWLGVAPTVRLPGAGGDPAQNTYGDLRSVSVTVAENQTNALIRRVSRHLAATPRDVLVAALVHAVTEWTGSDHVVVNLEGHGRETISEDVETAATVGWFTTIFPVALRVDLKPVAADRLVPAIRDQLAAVPRNGIGYGVLRHLGPPEVRTALAAKPAPEIGFNYLGQSSDSVFGLGVLSDEDEPTGRSVGDDVVRPHLLDVVCAVVDGVLGITVQYNHLVHERSVAQRLAESMQEFLQSVIDTVPADEPAGTGSEHLPLAPLQVGMLLHSAVTSSATSPYVVQFADEFIGVVDIDRLRRAWASVLARHTILRTAFMLDDVGEPSHVVLDTVETPFFEEDWRHGSSDDQRRWTNELLARDLNQGFNTAHAPLTRWTAVRLADDRVLMVWTFHHLVLDGWSAQIVQKEALAFYQAEATCSEPALDEAVPFSRYLEWLAAQSDEEASLFWAQHLEGLTDPTPLGVNLPYGDNEFHDLELDLDVDLARRVVAFARANGLTVSTVLQGAWALLLSRYSGREDVVYGSTVSGRPSTLPCVDSMVGMFINTLPARVRVDPDAHVGRWLAAVQRQLARLRQYQHTPLVDIQKQTQIPASQPLFHSILSFENYPKALTDDDLPAGQRRRRLAHIERTVERTGYSLVLSVALLDERLALHLQSDSGAFDRVAAGRLLRHVEQILAELVSDPDRLVGTVRILTPAEDHLLNGWNGRTVERRSTPTHQLIAEQACRTPDAIAVEFGDEHLTYRELMVRSDRLARRLRRLGAGPGVAIGICVGRGLHSITALLGVARSGAFYVPIDPASPRARVDFVLTDVDAQALVADEHARAHRAHRTIPVIDLVDTVERDIGVAEEPLPEVSSDELAYVLYTSGSTGQPKGVMIEHRSLSERVQELAERFEVTSQDRFLHYAPTTFDGSVIEIYPALVCGARVLVREDDWTPDGTLQTIRERGVTLCMLPPFVWGAMIRFVSGRDAHGPQLRLVGLGGEQVRPSDVVRWFAATSVPLLNLYGPTEATVSVTSQLMTEPMSVVPIGTVGDNTRAQVVNALGQRVPVGVRGELWVAGPGLARGYLNRPEVTDSAFVVVPEDRCDIRWYRTGDIVRWLPNGALEFLGRDDEQVNLRGFRVECGEIESVLARHPGVTSCAVVAVADGEGGSELAAFCVLTRPDSATVATLRSWCSERLPEHMVPSAVTFMSELPITANGKGVDRAALALPSTPEPVRTSSPGTLAERIAQLCASVLRRPSVGLNEDFFALGGDSMSNLRLIGAARAAGLGLTPRMVLLHRTATAMAMALQTSSAPGDPTSTLLHTLNDGPRESTIVCLHEGSGQISAYVPFAHLMETKALVVGIEAASLRSGGDPDDDAHALARRYWKLIREVVPEGPYALVGYSFGGALALEITRLVEAAGATVELLVAIDSILPGPASDDLIQRDYQTASELLKQLVMPARTWRDRSDCPGHIISLLSRLNLPEEMLDLADDGLIQHLRHLKAHMYATSRFRPPRVSAPLLLLQAEMTASTALPPAQTWHPHVDDVEVHTLPGDHASLMRAPHVVQVAERVEAALGRVRRTWPAR